MECVLSGVFVKTVVCVCLVVSEMCALWSVWKVCGVSELCTVDCALYDSCSFCTSYEMNTSVLITDNLESREE